ncbi:uncharacterized protein LOC112589632 [Harpegnathos saltator]|uniref:uncharacterized protein LOC112589632 n=1 Tax=Harpegnathos saltator TaxID=610380 RepID=UPI000DBECFA8|nr:uncharacterized protein LOC112589632 [Harpegnathos saltator]XP_025159431.1 uncharacterized protein LOC112589632 [Harpegnathos saltator]XP_025159432.1 uncharacterized protein LOC112589632 [Harpegnathos saltator]XP_025159433.1 uncharacterized protein LOC112589632 [Harpegnathos saltator]
MSRLSRARGAIEILEIPRNDSERNHSRMVCHAYETMMPLQQVVELGAVKQPLTAYCREVHPENFELSARVHCEGEEEAVVPALRDAVDEDLQRLQDLDQAVSEGRVCAEDTVRSQE